MADLIDRDALMADIDGTFVASGKSASAYAEIRGAKKIIARIKAAPTIEAEPVKHGRWDVDGVYVVCSVCNRLTLSPIVKQLPTFKYCPNCGARMDEEGNDER